MAFWIFVFLHRRRNRWHLLHSLWKVIRLCPHYYTYACAVGRQGRKGKHIPENNETKLLLYRTVPVARESSPSEEVRVFYLGFFMGDFRLDRQDPPSANSVGNPPLFAQPYHTDARLGCGMLSRDFADPVVRPPHFPPYILFAPDFFRPPAFAPVPSSNCNPPINVYDRQATWWALKDNRPPEPGMVNLSPRVWQAWVVSLIAGSVLLLKQDMWTYTGCVWGTVACVFEWSYCCPAAAVGLAGLSLHRVCIQSRTFFSANFRSRFRSRHTLYLILDRLSPTPAHHFFVWAIRESFASGLSP